MRKISRPAGAHPTHRQMVILCFYAITFHIMSSRLHVVDADWLVKCGDCKCKWNSGKKTADCKNITLEHIPQHLSSELQVLDLSFNTISEIENSAFTSAELQNLHKLFMRNCSLDVLHPQGLAGLEILIELDLSNNVIKTLPKDVFVSLVKLRSLILNNNLIETLEDGLFRNLKYLHKVELTDNRISVVGNDVFVNLPFLSQIFLNGNRLTFLRKETFEKLKRLASLSLESNPWNCTCVLQPFRDFTLKRNLYTQPTACYTPTQLRGMLWTVENQPEAFACKPKIIYPSRGASINTSKENVTLICRVHASPNTIISWDYNKQIYASNYQARVNVQRLREDSELSPENSEFGRDVFISRLTIFNAEKSDEGTYTCVAENAGGKDEVQMNLLVQKHTHQSILLQHNLIIIICLMVLGLLSCSIFLAMVTCCIYKRFKAMNQRGSGTGNIDQQLHHQKHQTFNGLNVVNAINHPLVVNHQGMQLGGGGVVGGRILDEASKYAEIKQTKLSSDSTTGSVVSAAEVLNNFSDLVERGTIGGGGGGGVVGSYYHHSHQNSNQGAVLTQKHLPHHIHDEHELQKQQQQQQQTIDQRYSIYPSVMGQQNAQSNCSTLSGRHKQQETVLTTPTLGPSVVVGSSGDYQPDLLPYIPQSISFNNSSLYSYSKSLSANHQQQQQQSQQLTQHKNLYDNHHKHQYKHMSNYRESESRTDGVDDLRRYGNNFRRTQTSNSCNKSNREYMGDMAEHVATGEEHPEYLHYAGIMGGVMSPTGKTGSATISTAAAKQIPAARVRNDELQRPPTTEATLLVAATAAEILARRGGGSFSFDESSSTEMSDAHGQNYAVHPSSYNQHPSSYSAHHSRHQSIVRSSPSLNFLSNYYQRRELL